MVFFPNRTIEIWEPLESTEYDEYTDDYLIKWSITHIIKVDWQPISAKESMEEFGEILQDTYKIYTQTKIKPSSRIRIRGEPDTYKVQGTPQYNDHFHATTHHKIILIKEQTPHKFSGE